VASFLTSAFVDMLPGCEVAGSLYNKNCFLNVSQMNEIFLQKNLKEYTSATRQFDSLMVLIQSKDSYLFVRYLIKLY
jgi:hypothetical protein